MPKTSFWTYLNEEQCNIVIVILQEKKSQNWVIFSFDKNQLVARLETVYPDIIYVKQKFKNKYISEDVAKMKGS